MLRNILCVGLLGVSIVSAARAGEPTVANTPTDAVAADGLFIHWREHIIDDEVKSGLPLRGADGFELADFDQDGHLDVAVMWEDSSHLRISFGGDDADHWQTVTLAAGAEVKEIEDGAVGDVNGDGWLALLVATEGGSLLYLQNPGEGIREGAWERVVPSVTSDRGSWIRVYLADLNRDGRLEAIAVNKGVTMPSGKGSMDAPPTPVSWFSIGDKPLEADAWVEHELNRTVIPVNARPIDLDGDGLLDVLYTRGNSGEYDGLYWLRQERSESPQAVFTPAREKESRALPLPDSFLSRAVNWILR